MRRACALLCLGLLLVFAGGCSKDAQDEAGQVAKDAAKTVEEGAKTAADRAEDVVNDRTVVIDDFLFRPDSRKVTVGTEVTWVNHGSVAHTVTSDNDAFDSGQIEVDKEFSNRFTQKGKYAYHCENHPDQMKGSIVVGG
jgi:plastocyanin